MFKTKEEVASNSTKEFAAGVEYTFKSFVERIKFYKKYHNDYKQFLKDFPYIEKKSYYLWLNHHNFDNESEHHNEFNCWLFNYCFSDVLE